MFSTKEPTNKSQAPQAYRAVQVQGNDYRQAGCLPKIVNDEIGSLCKPHGVDIKLTFYFVRQLEKDASFHCATFRTLSQFTLH